MVKHANTNMYINTFKIDKSQILSAIVLHHLNSIHDDGSTEEVGQGKDVDLLQRLSFLVSECQYCRPVLSQLVLPNTVTLCMRLALLLLLPPLVEPNTQ